MDEEEGGVMLWEGDSDLAFDAQVVAFGCDGGDDLVFDVKVHADDGTVDVFEGFADFFFGCPVVGA